MTDDDASRLLKCFSSVFPNVASEALRSASAANLAEWDSLAMIQLAMVIDEEFGTATDFDRITSLTSFEAWLAHVRNEASDA